MKVGIFIADSNGSYPVPASKGGAVSTLIENLIEKNNKEKKIQMTIVSYSDVKSEQLANKYPNIQFVQVKPPLIIRAIDNLLFYTVKACFKKKKAVSYKTVGSLLYFILIASKHLKKSKYDKVVIENNIPLAWIIKLSRYQGEYFYHFHNVPRLNAKVTEVFNNCSGYLCVSKFVADQISMSKNPIGPVNKSRLKVLYNCIDTDYFRPEISVRSKIRLHYNFTDRDKILLFVGRLSNEKGIDKLLEAVKLVKNDVKVLIVGSYIHNIDVKDEYQIYLRKLAAELGKKVIFTGYIPQNELVEIYNAVDIAVLPSMWDEPAGLTMIEAMACGIPVITTASGGISEYVGECSIVLERDNNLVKNIAKSIDGLLDGTITYPNEQAKNRINSNFSLNSYLDKFCECLC